MAGAGVWVLPAALYLAAAGVGTIVLWDGDTVDLTNLQRQILHHTTSVGRLKVESGRDSLHLINPEVEVVCLADRLAGCLLYTSDAADERSSVDLGGSRIIKKKK